MSTIRELCTAVRKGDVNAVRNFLKQYPNLDLNQTAEYFEGGIWGTKFFDENKSSSAPSMYLGPCTPLMIAAAYKHQDIVKLLVESGRVNINFQGGRGNDHTALDCAKQWGSSETVTYLVNNGGKCFKDVTGWDFVLQAGEKVVPWLIDYFTNSQSNKPNGPK